MTTLSLTPVEKPAAAEQLPPRVWLLAALGAVAGLLVYWIARPDRYLPDQLTIRSAGAMSVAVFALLCGLLLERIRTGWNLGFSIVGASVVGLVTYWCGPYDWGEPWKLACAAIGVGIATPLFQAWRGAPSANLLGLPYADAYRLAWRDVVVCLVAFAFTIAVWVVLYMLGQLFKLIGIRVIADLLGESWVAFPLTGAAFGAGIGLIRQRENILSLLFRGITTILSILAPLLALGLVIFLLAVPFTGLQPIWGATRSTTGILLSCIVAALWLVNAVIADEEAHEARHPALGASVAVLCVSILPLGVMAAISTGVRIRQHGYTPDRLWALVFTVIACAYGLAYLVTLMRHRRAAAPYLRVDNLRLALGMTLLFLLLASPLIDFGAISTRDQVARLEDGRTRLREFDWGALRYGFGPSGEAEVRRFAREGKTPELRGAAAYALKEDSRSALTPSVAVPRRPPVDPADLTILPRGAKLPAALLEKLGDYGACDTMRTCLIRYDRARGEAVIVTTKGANVYRLKGGQWRRKDDFRVRDDAEVDRIEDGLEAGRIEVREVTRRQVFVDGIPVGGNFE